MTVLPSPRPGARPTTPLLLALLLLLAGLAPTTVVGQSAVEILQSVADRYEQRLEGIRNYTVVHEVMGMTSTSYFERGPDGDFEGRIVDGPGAGSASSFAPNSPGDFARMADGATYEGTETLDGRETHVIRLEDFTAFDEYMESQGMYSESEMVPESMVIWIDTERLVPLRMEMHGTMTVNGRSGAVTSTIAMEDYREVEGMLYPFATRVQTAGMAELMDITPEQMEQMRAQMEQMRAQLDRMPAAQREMMERMMGEQMEQVEQMLESGAMDMSITVTELRVNERPPAG